VLRRWEEALRVLKLPTSQRFEFPTSICAQHQYLNRADIIFFSTSPHPGSFALQWYSPPLFARVHTAIFSPHVNRYQFFDSDLVVRLLIVLILSFPSFLQSVFFPTSLPLFPCVYVSTPIPLDTSSSLYFSFVGLFLSHSPFPLSFGFTCTLFFLLCMLGM